MRKLCSGWALVLLLISFGFVPVAYAAGPSVSANDARALQLVVRAQLDAFAADDAARAFSYATPTIQTMFGTPEQFLLMVRSTYPVVYRPASVTFRKPTSDAAVLVQPVHMTDDNGGAWIALYRLERQKDKSWRIAGCILVAESGKAV